MISPSCEGSPHTYNYKNYCIFYKDKELDIENYYALKNEINRLINKCYI